MNISEVELRTGITKQNIRFYEKKGLLTPKRNEENSYREYTESDVELLNLVKILRKLDLPIEDIRKIIDGEDTTPIIARHLDFLLDKKNDLEAAIAMCRFIIQKGADSMDTGMLLRKMDSMEKKGGRFMAILDDYKKVARTEAKRTFSFAPENMALTPQEFTESLCKYGAENNLNLVVTEEGMYPKFEIDGLEYEAFREFGRFGAVITCKVTHPELLKEEYKDIPEKSSSILRNIYWGIFHFAVPVVLFIYFCFVSKNFWLAVYMEILYVCFIRFAFKNFHLR